MHGHQRYELSLNRKCNNTARKCCDADGLLLGISAIDQTKYNRRGTLLRFRALRSADNDTLSWTRRACATISTNDPRYREDDEEEKFPLTDATILGYSDVEDEWQLAVKDVTLSEFDGGGYYHPESYEVVNSGAPRPLLKAGRTLRVKAMDRIPSLLDELKSSSCRQPHR